MPGIDKKNKTKLEEFKSLGTGRRKAKTPSELDLGTGKASSKRTQKPELNLGSGKASSKRTGPAELNLGSGKASSKRTKPKTKVQPPKLRPKNLKKKEKNSDSKKSKIVTEKMLADSPFTSLRDYLNNRDGKKRRDGKKVELKSGKTKTAKMSAKASNDAQSTQKVISKKTQTDFKKSGAFKGTDGAPGDNKKPKIKRKSTSNIIGNKNFVSDKKKKK